MDTFNKIILDFLDSRTLEEKPLRFALKNNCRYMPGLFMSYIHVVRKCPKNFNEMHSWFSVKGNENIL